jgi:hypothetical protein
MPLPRRTLFLGISLLLVVPWPARSDHRLESRPDSLSSVFGLDLDKEALEELSGVGLLEFRLYTSAERSRIAWMRGDVLYIYSLDGDRHDERALALLAALRASELWSFVARRQGGRLRQYTEAREVLAIQLQAIRPLTR